jgi:hypothetical protein
MVLLRDGSGAGLDGDRIVGVEVRPRIRGVVVDPAPHEAFRRIGAQLLSRVRGQEQERCFSGLPSRA